MHDKCIEDLHDEDPFPRSSHTHPRPVRERRGNGRRGHHRSDARHERRRAGFDAASDGDGFRLREIRPDRLVDEGAARLRPQDPFPDRERHSLRSRETLVPPFDHSRFGQPSHACGAALPGRGRSAGGGGLGGFRDHHSPPLRRSPLEARGTRAIPERAPGTIAVGRGCGEFRSGNRSIARSALPAHGHGHR